MKRIIILLCIVMSLNVSAQDYQKSTCYQSYQAEAKEHVEKIKHKQEEETFGKKVSRFFCSFDKATQLLMQQPGSAAQQLKDCDQPIDYRKQNNSQVILNLSYSNANSLKATDDKDCHSMSPCHKSIYTLGGTDITGSMEIASDILKDARKINPDIKQWSHIQSIVQNGMSNNTFCEKNKTWPLRKIKKYILKQIKNETVQAELKVEDAARTEDSKEDNSDMQNDSETQTSSSTQE